MEIDRELMIRDLSVVNDPRTQGPDGDWSFGHLIKEMSAGTNPSRFVVTWLKTFEQNQPVNGFVVPARPRIRTAVIDPWKAKDGQAGVADDQWQVHFENAPFRLLAIVNRMDLNRGTPARVDSAGEGRFVFGVLDAAGNPLPFTVIFEYELLATDRSRLRGWAQEWHELGTKPFGPGYNQALQQITDKFTRANGAPSKPNGSALNQLRTNEIALDFTNGWELREFNILPDGQLHQVTVKQTPSNSFQNTSALASFVNLRTPELLDGSLFMTPKLDDGQDFLSGAALIAPPLQGFFWNAPGIQNNEARHKLAFLTCNGCHHKETATTGFLHVANRQQNATAQLSGFLTGVSAPDPVTGASHDFHDLQDRADILKLLAEEPGSIRLQGMQQNRAARVH